MSIVQQQGGSERTEMQRPKLGSLLSGFSNRCPACQHGRLLGNYLKVVDHCANCGEAFHHQRADDAPAYFTVLITGHLLVPMMLVALSTTTWPSWVHTLLWCAVAILMMGTLLPRIKGALVALQWALRMHGFAGSAEEFTEV